MRWMVFTISFETPTIISFILVFHMVICAASGSNGLKGHSKCDNFGSNMNSYLHRNHRILFESSYEFSVDLLRWKENFEKLIRTLSYGDYALELATSENKYYWYPNVPVSELTSLTNYSHGVVTFDLVFPSHDGIFTSQFSESHPCKLEFHIPLLSPDHMDYITPQLLSIPYSNNIAFSDTKLLFSLTMTVPKAFIEIPLQDLIIKALTKSSTLKETSISVEKMSIVPILQDSQMSYEASFQISCHIEDLAYPSANTNRFHYEIINKMKSLTNSPDFLNTILQDVDSSFREKNMISIDHDIRVNSVLLETLTIHSSFEPHRGKLDIISVQGSSRIQRRLSSQVILAVVPVGAMLLLCMCIALFCQNRLYNTFLICLHIRIRRKSSGSSGVHPDLTIEKQEKETVHLENGVYSHGNGSPGEAGGFSQNSIASLASPHPSSPKVWDLDPFLGRGELEDKREDDMIGHYVDGDGADESKTPSSFIMRPIMRTNHPITSQESISSPFFNSQWDLGEMSTTSRVHPLKLHTTSTSVVYRSHSTDRLPMAVASLESDSVDMTPLGSGHFDTLTLVRSSSIARNKSGVSGQLSSKDPFDDSCSTDDIENRMAAVYPEPILLPVLPPLEEREGPSNVLSIPIQPYYPIGVQSVHHEFHSVGVSTHKRDASGNGDGEGINSHLEILQQRHIEGGSGNNIVEHAIVEDGESSYLQTSRIIDRVVGESDTFKDESNVSRSIGKTGLSEASTKNSVTDNHDGEKSNDNSSTKEVLVSASKDPNLRVARAPDDTLPEPPTTTIYSNQTPRRTSRILNFDIATIFPTPLSRNNSLDPIPSRTMSSNELRQLQDFRLGEDLSTLYASEPLKLGSQMSMRRSASNTSVDGNGAGPNKSITSPRNGVGQTLELGNDASLSRQSSFIANRSIISPRNFGSLANQGFELGNDASLSRQSSVTSFIANRSIISPRNFGSLANQGFELGNDASLSRQSSVTSFIANRSIISPRNGGGQVSQALDRLGNDSTLSRQSSVASGISRQDSRQGEGFEMSRSLSGLTDILNSGAYAHEPLKLGMRMSRNSSSTRLDESGGNLPPGGMDYTEYKSGYVRSRRNSRTSQDSRLSSRESDRSDESQVNQPVPSVFDGQLSRHGSQRKIFDSNSNSGKSNNDPGDISAVLSIRSGLSPRNRDRSIPDFTVADGTATVRDHGDEPYLPRKSSKTRLDEYNSQTRIMETASRKMNGVEMNDRIVSEIQTQQLSASEVVPVTGGSLARQLSPRDSDGSYRTSAQSPRQSRARERDESARPFTFSSYVMGEMEQITEQKRNNNNSDSIIKMMEQEIKEDEEEKNPQTTSLENDMNSQTSFTNTPRNFTYEQTQTVLGLEVIQENNEYEGPLQGSDEIRQGDKPSYLTPSVIQDTSSAQHIPSFLFTSSVIRNSIRNSFMSSLDAIMEVITPPITPMTKTIERMPSTSSTPMGRFIERMGMTTPVTPKDPSMIDRMGSGDLLDRSRSISANSMKFSTPKDSIKDKFARDIQDILDAEALENSNMNSLPSSNIRVQHKTSIGSMRPVTVLEKIPEGLTESPAKLDIVEQTTSVDDVNALNPRSLKSSKTNKKASHVQHHVASAPRRHSPTSDNGRHSPTASTGMHGSTLAHGRHSPTASTGMHGSTLAHGRHSPVAVPPYHGPPSPKRQTTNASPKSNTFNPLTRAFAWGSENASISSIAQQNNELADRSSGRKRRNSIHHSPPNQSDGVLSKPVLTRGGSDRMNLAACGENHTAEDSESPKHSQQGTVTVHKVSKSIVKRLSSNKG